MIPFIMWSLAMFVAGFTFAEWLRYRSKKTQYWDDVTHEIERNIK